MGGEGPAASRGQIIGLELSGAGSLCRGCWAGEGGEDECLGKGVLPSLPWGRG